MAAEATEPEASAPLEEETEGPAAEEEATPKRSWIDQILDEIDEVLE